MRNKLILGTVTVIALISTAAVAWLCSGTQEVLPLIPVNDQRSADPINKPAPPKIDRQQVAATESAINRVQRGNPSAEPSLLGATQVPKDSVSPTIEPSFQDEVLATFYKRAADDRATIERECQEATARGQLTNDQREHLAVARTVEKLIAQQRLYYYGPAKTMPNYSALQSPTVRYWATAYKGTMVVIEMMQVEFPEVFEHDSRVLIHGN